MFKDIFFISCSTNGVKVIDRSYVQAKQNVYSIAFPVINFLKSF